MRRRDDGDDGVWRLPEPGLAAVSLNGNHLLAATTGGIKLDSTTGGSRKAVMMYPSGVRCQPMVIIAGI